MKRLLVLAFAALLLFVAGCGKLAPSKPTPAPAPNPAPSNSTPTPEAEKPKDQNPNAVSPKTPIKVKVFLIALDDNGKSGKKIDSGDSLVPVVREINNPTTPLRGAMDELLSIKDRNYGQSGLYNPLSASSLKVDSISVQNGIANINLSGQFSLGGVMDIPRVKGQLTETALQFSTVKTVLIKVNGKTLDDALSLK